MGAVLWALSRWERNVRGSCSGIFGALCMERRTAPVRDASASHGQVFGSRRANGRPVRVLECTNHCRFRVFTSRVYGEPLCHQ